MRQGDVRHIKFKNNMDLPHNHDLKKLSKVWICATLIPDMRKILGYFFRQGNSNRFLFFMSGINVTHFESSGKLFEIVIVWEILIFFYFLSDINVVRFGSWGNSFNESVQFLPKFFLSPQITKRNQINEKRKIF